MLWEDDQMSACKLVRGVECSLMNSGVSYSEGYTWRRFVNVVNGKRRFGHKRMRC